jgi:hypothetical protein
MDSSHVLFFGVYIATVCDTVPLANDGITMTQTCLFSGGNHILLELN